MKEKSGSSTLVLVGLGLLAVGLVIALIYRNHAATVQQEKDAATIVVHSNHWVQANTDLQEQKQVNLNLETELTTTKTENTNLVVKLDQTTTNLIEAQMALKYSQEEVAKRDARIAELETQNSTLEKQSLDLTNALAMLNVRIADTQAKLTASEGDKAALEKELQRLLGEKAELERKFNDLAVVRAQVKKLKTELVTTKRLGWMRNGVAISEPKAAERSTGTGGAKPRRYDLNVEVKSDGSVNVIPPINRSSPQSGQPGTPIEMK